MKKHKKLEYIASFSVLGLMVAIWIYANLIVFGFLPLDPMLAEWTLFPILPFLLGWVLILSIVVFGIHKMLLRRR